MGRSKALTYGEIADAVLPSVVFTLDTLNVLAQAVDTYVQLAPRDRRVFFQEQMTNIWPTGIDWTSRPQTAEFKSQWSALRRYFKEQGRIRGPPALPEKLSTRKWTGLRVCGVVYRDSIDEMVFIGTGMKPGDSRGYIGHRMKCRTVFYWKLSPDDCRQLVEMAQDWQSGSAPAEQKMDAYYRQFQSWIRSVHMTGLREFGQHLVTMSIPEPGLTNPPRLYEFMHELKILDKPLVKAVNVGDTLSDIYLEVNHAAGRIEGAALPAVLNKKSRLKLKTTWSLSEDSFLGHDGLILKEEEFDEELFYKEAISMVYLIVRMAHSNVSRYRDLDPPWSSFEQLVDARYLLPDIPMCIPTALRQPNCFKYLKHWFTVTKGLQFKLWQRKNSLPMTPVPLGERWWANSLTNSGESIEAVPPAAMLAMDYVPRPVKAADVRGLDQFCKLSPYGSAGGHLIHEDSVREQEAMDMLEVPPVPDPDDFLPAAAAELEELELPATAGTQPCVVPDNGEARAQWCISQLKTHCSLPLRASRFLRSAIQELTELPMIPNCSYPLKSAARRAGLPADLNWDRREAGLQLAEGDMSNWISFLCSSPWHFTQGDADVYAGTELVWVFVLGWVLYLQGFAEAGGSAVGDQGVGVFTVGCTSFSKVFEDFRDALREYRERFDYPGWAPSVKYALVNSRSHYLAYLVRNEEQDVLLPLVKLVTRMEDGPLEAPLKTISHTASPNAPSWITDTDGVPSWQWQRCGLPPAAHSIAELPDAILDWLRRPDLLVNTETGTARNRESGLAVLLKAALIFCDLDNIDDGNWTSAGAAVLEQSSLRSRTRELKSALADWANEQALRLEPLLRPRHLDGDAEDDGDEDQDGALDDEESLAQVRRPPVSEVMPADLDPAFTSVDIADLDLPYSVEEYRSWLDSQPRTAVQELSRKGLQGLAQLHERKKINRALRAGVSAGGQQASTTPQPVARRTAGAWLPMPPLPGTAPLSDDDDEDQPPRKRRRTLVVKKSARQQRPTAGKPAPTKARRVRLPPRQKGRTTKPVQRSAKRQASESDTDVNPSSSSSSESELVFSGGASPVAQSPLGLASDDEMPARISTGSSRYHDLITPVVFDAQSCSSGMEIDSDAMGSALSERVVLPRRLAFVDPRPSTSRSIVGCAQESGTVSPPAVRPRPRFTAKTLALRRQKEEERLAQSASSNAAPPTGLRRSLRRSNIPAP